MRTFGRIKANLGCIRKDRSSVLNDNFEFREAAGELYSCTTYSTSDVDYRCVFSELCPSVIVDEVAVKKRFGCDHGLVEPDTGRSTFRSCVVVPDGLFEVDLES